jgi:hypothetical protein
MSTLVINLYGLSELKSGLTYLPFGLGSCIGAYFSGSLLNLLPLFAFSLDIGCLFVFVLPSFDGLIERIRSKQEG